MDPEMALSIIRPLAEGVDPVSGEELAEHSPCQHPRVVRELIQALAALESENERGRRRKDQPRNTGMAWSEEEQSLADGYDRGTPVKELAGLRERSVVAIEARLVPLGKSSANVGFRGRFSG